MKLSKQTMQILENFCNINKSINIDEKNILKTKSESGKIIGLAKIQEDLSPLAIHDLNEFINVIKMFDQSKDIDFSFDDKKVTFKQGKTVINTVNSNPDHIYNKCKAYDKYFVDKEFEASFPLEESEMQTIFRASSVILKDTKEFDKTIKINMKDGEGKLTIYDSVNSAANKFVQDISGSGNVDFTFIVPEINLIKGNYDVFVFSQYVKFVCGDICYIVMKKSGE